MNELDEYSISEVMQMIEYIWKKIQKEYGTHWAETPVATYTDRQLFLIKKARDLQEYLDKRVEKIIEI